MSFIYVEPAAEWYPRILGRINGLLQKTEITGKQAEITRHYLLAALEIYLSVDSNYFANMAEYHKESTADGTSYNREMHEQFAEYARNFSIAMLSKLARENSVDEEYLVRATEELMNDKALALSTMPYLIRYRLTECCVALEYPDAPLGFYRELVSRGIISCDKYSSTADKIVDESGSELSLLFIRAGLLFEFKMLQRSLAVITSLQKNGTVVLPALDSRMPRPERKKVADYYKRIVDIWLLETQPNSFASFKCKDSALVTNAEQLLKQMSQFYFHKRMFGGTQGRWLGTLGAFDIEVSRWEEPRIAIYYESNNNHTISDKISSKFGGMGLIYQQEICI